MSRKIIFTIGLLVLLSGCTVLSIKQSSIQTSVDSGSTVTIGQTIRVTFNKSIVASTVIGETLFIVPRTGSANSFINSLIRLKSTTSQMCNPANAVTSTVECTSDTDCDITPTLNYSSNYTLCITNGIQYSNGTSLIGKTVNFSTESNNTANYTVGGTISGLGDGNTLVIRNNGGDDLSITSNGNFTFATSIANGSAYSVDVYKRVANQNCILTNTSGTVSGANVTNVTISCGEFHIFVTTDTNSGDFTTGYTSGIAGADAYCMAERPDGMIGTYKALISDGTNRVACVNENCSSGATEHIDWVLAPQTDYYRTDDTTKLGTTDLLGLFFVESDLDTNLTDDTFYIWTGLNSDWTVGDNCNLWSDSSGIYGAAYGETDYSDINVISYDWDSCDNTASLACVEQPTYTRYTYTIGGTISGFSSGESVVVQNNGGDDLTLSANGSFKFATKLTDNAAYNITLVSIPSGKGCSISNNPGTVSGDDVTNIVISCTPCMYIFETTNSAPNGNMAAGHANGIQGADAICQSEAASKGWSGVYKALIVDDTHRSANNPITNWVLLASQAYCRKGDGAYIGNTNTSSTFDFPITNAFGSGGEIWTGLNSDWSTSETCNDWTYSGGDSPYGIVGLADNEDSNAIFAYEQTCNRDNVRLICVQQLIR